MNLISTDEKRVTTCHTTESDIFSTRNIIEFESHVRSIQGKLDKAVANGDKDHIRWYVHLLSKKSRAVKILAIYRICEINKGRHTAGVDGIAMPVDRNERHRVMESMTDEIDITSKPSPIRRVYIPKPNGDTRPLGIPTIKDRITQEIIRQSIEPICEYHFLSCSYGFRPKRSCHDAMADLYNKLRRKDARRWVIEGDIKGCFEHIRHDHIISTLKEWDIPIIITEIIRKMLKAKIMENLSLTPSHEGTPQGGVISPMLANVALTCLDNEVNSRYGVESMNPIVRYADDFAITALSEQHANEIKIHIGEYLKTEVGLTLSDDKTHITEISTGFDFLGFNFRKYEDKLLIKPSKDNVNKVTSKLRSIFNGTDNTHTLILKLNPVITGWGNYYRHVVSKQTFRHIDQKVWEMIKRWLGKKHKTISHDTLWKYHKSINNNNWHFADRDTDTTLVKIVKIPIKRFVKVKKDMRVYDVNAKGYWAKREYMNALDSIYGSATMTQLFKRQKGKCEYCGESITDKQVRETAIHKHHLKPRSEGGDWKLGNLRLLHADCHNSLHSMYSRKEMADLIDKGIDYLRLMKPDK